MMMIARLLIEPVDVTPVTPNMVLIERVEGPGAVTVEASEDGELLVNGRPETLNPDDLYALTRLADTVLVGMAEIGRTARVVPE